MSFDDNDGTVIVDPKDKLITKDWLEAKLLTNRHRSRWGHDDDKSNNSGIICEGGGAAVGKNLNNDYGVQNNIEITINLNVSDNVNLQSLNQLEGILKQLTDLQSNQIKRRNETRREEQFADDEHDILRHLKRKKFKEEHGIVD